MSILRFWTGHRQNSIMLWFSFSDSAKGGQRNPLGLVVNSFFLTLSRRHILDSSKLKKCADDNFKFDENGRKFSNRVENTVGKGEIARFEQFLLFLQCFQKTCPADR